MIDLKIGIVGGGIVGQATARSFLEHVCEVRVYDELPERRTHSLAEVKRCDLVFICLPTPARDDGGCDISALTNHIKLFLRGCTVPLVIRSTVPIGTTRLLALANDLPLIHSPEFLTARCAQVDAQMPSRLVIGYTFQSRTDWESMDALSVVKSLYERRFPHCPIHVMSSDESEAVKLFQNAFFAVKVGFFNEVRNLADNLGLDWDPILRAVLADGRICPSHTNVPGPDGKRGFGGACLPKDLTNLLSCFDKANVPCPISRGAIGYDNTAIKEELP
jgi:UDPglucose 6-dehydrogenase